MRQMVQGTTRHTSRALPRALALARSSPWSGRSPPPPAAAAPLNPNTLSARNPTKGEAHAASAISKDLHKALHISVTSCAMWLSKPMHMSMCRQADGPPMCQCVPVGVCNCGLPACTSLSVRMVVCHVTCCILHNHCEHCKSLSVGACPNSTKGLQLRRVVCTGQSLHTAEVYTTTKACALERAFL